VKTLFARASSALAAAALLGAGAGLAQEGEAKSERFVFDATLYGWLAGASGEFTPFTGAPTIEFENAFGEVLEDLDLAFFGSVHAHNGSVALLADLSYASLSREGRVPPGIPAEGSLRQFSLTAAAGPRVLNWPGGSVDIFAGARLWDVDATIDVPLAGISASPGRTFVDPIVGVRAVGQVAPRFSVLGYADFGGAGVGSDLTYQLVATANYRAGRGTFLSLGYRHLWLDYDRDGTAIEASMTGPVIGITQRF
jgi:hypothetical protein